MKPRNLVIIAIASLSVFSCAGRVSGNTTIKGDFAGTSAPEDIRVIINEINLDTTITVDSSAGGFEIDVPTDVTCCGRLIVDGTDNIPFVPDGTVLSLSDSEDGYVLKSSAPKTSVNERLNAYISGMGGLADEFGRKSYDIQSRDLTEGEMGALIDKLYDSLITVVGDLNDKTFKENTDNYVAVEVLLNSADMYDDAQLSEKLDALSPKMQEHSVAKEFREIINVKSKTAVGQKFVDFEVVQDPSNPDGSKVKLSDYAGKGKYLLVDFWASWCGPCRREIPNLKAVYEKYHGPEFDILGVAVWDKPADSKTAAKELEMPWNLILNAQKVPTDIYGVEGIPFIMLIGPDGVILNRNLRGDAIEAEVAKYVKPVK